MERSLLRADVRPGKFCIPIAMLSTHAKSTRALRNARVSTAVI